MKRIKSLFILLGLSISLSVYAEPIIVKIGSAAPKTGGIAHLGIDNENGVRLAIEDINAKGDLVISGQKVVLQLVGEDDQGEPKMGPVVAQKLVDEGVVAVVGHLNSGVSIPANEVYAHAGMIQISPSSTNPVYTTENNLTPKGHISGYRLVAHDGLNSQALANFILKNTKIRNIILLGDSTGYGKKGVDELKRYFEGTRVNVLAHQSETDKVNDFVSILQNTPYWQADAVFWGGMADDVVNLAEAMKRLGMSVPIVGLDAIYTDFYSIEDKKLLNGAYAVYSGFGFGALSESGMGLKDLPRGQWFIQHYEHFFNGLKVQIYSPYAYDAIYAIVEAMKIANSVDREAIAASMSKVDFQGVTGRVRFDIRGDIVSGLMSVVQLRNGQWVTVDTQRLDSDPNRAYSWGNLE